VVGKIQFFGRVVGNHHIGEGEARDVDVLKGVNCAYRRDVIGDIGFDKRLVGTGAQPHWELSLGIAVKKRGYRLVYDPAILVDHYPAPRHDEDQRWTFSSVAVANAAQNEAIALFDLYVSWRRLIYILWFLLIGVRDYPGLLQALRLLMHRERHVASRWRASMRGRIRALIGLFPR
jgi:GT2 family glycosyltransferase